MDVYQGKMKTISPAIGPYEILLYMDIDKISTETGGVTGMGTLEPVNWGMEYTGINQNNFTNAKRGW